MRILAIDTALSTCSAGILDSTEGRMVASESVAMVRGHAEALMPLVARVMDAAGVEFSNLDRIAVTVGPGSFTGLRVGLSAARALALATGKPAVGISTLAAHAASHVADDKAGTVVAAIDAHHDQVYLQIFGPGGRSLAAPCLVPVGDAVSMAAGAAVVVGSGAPILFAQWPDGMKRPFLDNSGAPDIARVAQLAAAADPARSLPKPLYLRAPDARPQDASRLPRR